MSGAFRWIGRALVWLLICAAVLFAWSQTVRAQRLEAQRQVEQDVARLEQDVRLLERVAADESAINAELRGLEEEQARLNRTLPSQPAKEALALAIDGIARDLGVVLTSTRWEKAEAQELYDVLPLALEVRGAPERVLLLVSRVLSGERLLLVRSGEMTCQKERAPLCDFNLKADAPYVPDRL